MKEFKYPSGEAVMPGDQVRYHGDSGTVEFVAAETSGDPALDWYITEFGGGVMLNVSTMGNVFLSDGDIDEHLAFVGRRQF